MWIDLTRSIEDGLAGYGDDPKTSLKQIKDIKDDGYSLYHLSMGMHTGTHIDTPRHMIDAGCMVDELPVEQLTGNAVLIDASAVSLVMETHKDASKIQKNDVVLVYGGKTNTVIDESFARLLVRKQIKVLGIDFSSPDESPYEVHKLLFAKNILIVENLCRLERLAGHKEIFVVIAPLKVKADGAPARVFAKI